MNGESGENLLMLHKVENTPVVVNVPEFPPLTKNDIEEIKDLAEKLRMVSIPGFEEYTGKGQTIGNGDIVYNSIITLNQFVCALAMTRHPLLREAIRQEPSLSQRNFLNAEILIKEKIMSGMKILDLGSGSLPVFARCCRTMGADIWTVDKNPISGFSWNKNEEVKKLPIEQINAESEKHIILDLNDPEAVKIIEQKTGGNFNLVTEAGLIPSGFLKGGEIALPLLKIGGVYYNSKKFSDAVLKE